MKWQAKWIKSEAELSDTAPVFGVKFHAGEKDNVKIEKAVLYITAMGVYRAVLNGKRVGKFVLAPGWTSYRHRLQYQAYDVKDLLENDNVLEVTVGKGWYHSAIAWSSPYQQELMNEPIGMLAQLEITYTNGYVKTVCSGDEWKVSGSNVLFSEIYDGEIYDARITPMPDGNVETFDGPFDILIPQEGEEIREQERIEAANIFTTPKGETVVDFGQNLTGYVEINLKGSSGDVVDLSFAEVMDKEGNFYNENYRAAKCMYHYICTDGEQSWHPLFTFYGFRYIRINEFPGGVTNAAPENFTAIVIHSDMKRTGYLCCSDTELNQLFSNIIWGQKGNFVDVPTDCPQRDERLGWTGDAQVFIKTACLNFDTEKFYAKWLADMAADQRPNGCVGHVIPDLTQKEQASAAWGDAAVICPWTVYMAYGDKDILRRQYPCMKNWISYITDTTTTPYLWTGAEHYGDWLGLDAPSGSYKGSTREDFIASAFYAYSTELVIKAGRALGENVAEYERLYENIVNTFLRTYPVYTTQTECVLAAHFRLAPDPKAAADELAQRIEKCGGKLETGFVGTPYLLHVLSDYGHSALAYSLLLKRDYPSWLYSVTKGATTVWEHWDGIMENGDFWSSDMNSFNHYAYGSVADWVYCVAAGIQTIEEAPGYERVKIAPIPDERLDWLKAGLDTRHGYISSLWKKEGNFWRYEITTPVETQIVIDNLSHMVSPGSYCFYGKIK